MNWHFFKPLAKTRRPRLRHRLQVEYLEDRRLLSIELPPDQAILSIAKTVDEPRPNVGDTVTFRVTVHNEGLIEADDVAVNDPLPSGLTLLTAVPSQGSYDRTTGVWTVGVLPASLSQTLTITARVISPTAQTNVAVVTADQYTSIPNDTATATETPQLADLAVTKTVNNPTPTVGDTITYTIHLQNLGPDTATHVTLSDALPAGLQFLGATPSQGTFDNNTNVWTVGTLANGADVTLTVLAQVSINSPLTNTALVTHSDQFDTNTSNNESSVTVIPHEIVQSTPPTADLAVTKTVNDPTPTVGDTITYVISLQNLGPDSATNVTVLDTLPAGLQFLGATPSQGTFDSTTNVWTVGTLANGATVTLSFLARVDSASPLTNTASVDHSDQPDTNPNNNQSSVTVTPGVGTTPSVPPSQPVSPPAPTTGGTPSVETPQPQVELPTSNTTRTFLPASQVSKRFFLANSDDNLTPSDPASALASDPTTSSGPSNQALVSGANSSSGQQTPTATTTTNTQSANNSSVTPSSNTPSVGNQVVSFNQAGPSGMGPSPSGNTTLSTGNDPSGIGSDEEAGTDPSLRDANTVSDQSIGSPSKVTRMVGWQSITATWIPMNWAGQANLTRQTLDGRICDNECLLEIDQCFAVLGDDQALTTSSSVGKESGMTLAAFLCLAGLQIPLAAGGQARPNDKNGFTRAVHLAVREKHRRAGRRREYARTVS